MTQRLGWSVEFYTDARGRQPARDFILRLPNKERAVAVRVLELLEKYGIGLKMPYVRPIGGIWELRAGPNRFFYFLYTESKFIILHGYRKQSVKTPARELETAKRRMADFWEG